MTDSLRTHCRTTVGMRVDPDIVGSHNTHHDMPQTQITVSDDLTLHMDGDPRHWRLLAQAILNAADDVDVLAGRPNRRRTTVDTDNLPGLASE